MQPGAWRGCKKSAWWVLAFTLSDELVHGCLMCHFSCAMHWLHSSHAKVAHLTNPYTCRCNRENRHRGLCNSRATIPGAEAYSQGTEPANANQQSVAGACKLMLCPLSLVAANHLAWLWHRMVILLWLQGLLLLLQSCACKLGSGIIVLTGNQGCSCCAESPAPSESPSASFIAVTPVEGDVEHEDSEPGELIIVFGCTFTNTHLYVYRNSACSWCVTI